MADIRKMLGDLELQYPDFSGHYKDDGTPAVIQLPPMVEVKTQRERRLETSQAYIFEGEKGGKR